MTEALRKSERVVVVPYQPKRKLVLGLVAVLCVLLSCAAGFLYSAYRLEFWRADLLDQRESLIEQILSASTKLEVQEARLATISTGAEIDRQAAEELKLALAQRQRTIAELNEELSFYRNLMNPKAGQTGLDAYRFLVYGLADTKQLRYRLVLQQLGTGQKLITVSVKAELIGTIDGEPKQFLLNDLVTEQSAWRDSVKFRYYHDVEGRFELPEGFIPGRAEITLKETRRAPKVYTFDWEILE